MFNYMWVVCVNYEYFCMNLCMFYVYLCTGVNVYALVVVYKHIYLC